MTQFTPLRSQLDNWTLEDDNKCFLIIQNFTQSFMNKANEIQNSFKDTEYNINTFKAMVNNNFSKLSNLQNQKFTENKMAPTNDEELLFSKSNNNANDTSNETFSETALTQKYKEAVVSGMKSMNIDQFLDQNADAGNDDAISLTGGANDEKMSQFSQFTHIPSKHNKLPCVIGTSNFYNDPYLGIIELDDQIISKSQVQDLAQSMLIGFAPTQTIVPEIQIQQSTVVQDQQQQQFASNPAAPQAPSLDLLLQGAATKKTEPILPQVNIQPPPLNNNSIKFDYNKIDESVMYQESQQKQPGYMQESMAIQNQAPVERQSVQKKVRKPMFEDFSSSSDEGEKQEQNQQQQEQQIPAPVKAQPQALSIQDAFMMKLKKMQETKDSAPEPQQQTFQSPPPIEQKQKLPILESKIEVPTIMQGKIINRKGNNLFDEEDDDEIAVKPTIYNQPITEVNESKTQKKGMEMFGDDNDDQDETYEAFLQRETKQSEMKKFGTLLVDEDEDNDQATVDMFGSKKSEPKQVSGLPALPIIGDMSPPKKEKQKPMFQDEDIPQQKQPSPLVDQYGKALPSFDFENSAPKRSLLPKAKTSNNAFGDIPPPPNKPQQQQQQSVSPQKKQLPNLFEDDDDDDGLLFKKK